LQNESLQAKLLWSADDYEPLVAELRKNTNADSVILLKGSRGMALENILTPFIQEINT
jgi:UDP-N-acetylmuramoyl-tripeptide--D-alanyl-D-alanine ligase